MDHARPQANRPNPPTQARASEEAIDATLEATFPASDPPNWTGTHAGPPPNPRELRDVPGMRSLRVALPAAEGVARIESALGSAGMKLFARIDHAAEARAVGLSMRPAVVLIFGQPRGGTPIMIANPTAAIDLPLKALVWEADDGTTWLSYNTPSLLEQRHGVPKELLAGIAGAEAFLQRLFTRT